MDRTLLRLAELRREIDCLENEAGLAAPMTVSSVDERGDISAYRLIAEYASDFLSVHASNGDYVFASPNAERLFGYRPEELVGTNAYHYFHPDDVARIATDHAGHHDSRPGAVRYRLRTKSGEFRWVETRSSARRSDRGVEQIIAVTRDVNTETEALGRAADAEKALLSSQVGLAGSRLANAVGHELNNPLTAVIGELSVVLALDGLPTDVRLSLDRVEQALARILDLSKELRELAAAKVHPVELDLGALCHRAASLTSECQVVLQVEPLAVVADRGKLYQLVHNMITAFVGEEGPVLLTCGRVDGMVQIVAVGPRGPPRLRADLLSAVRGERLDQPFPGILAQQVCQQLGGTWTVEPARSGQISFRALLPIDASDPGQR